MEASPPGKAGGHLKVRPPVRTRDRGCLPAYLGGAGGAQDGGLYRSPPVQPPRAPCIGPTIADVLVQNGFDINILNSLWICVLSTVTVTILTAMAAYPLSRMHWKFRKLVIGYFGIGLIVPVYAALIPLYIMLRGVERCCWAAVRHWRSST